MLEAQSTVSNPCVGPASVAVYGFPESRRLSPLGIHFPSGTFALVAESARWLVLGRGAWVGAGVMAWVSRTSGDETFIRFLPTPSSNARSYTSSIVTRHPTTPSVVRIESVPPESKRCTPPYISAHDALGIRPAGDPLNFALTSVPIHGTVRARDTEGTPARSGRINSSALPMYWPISTRRSIRPTLTFRVPEGIAAHHQAARIAAHGVFAVFLQPAFFSPSRIARLHTVWQPTPVSPALRAWHVPDPRLGCEWKWRAFGSGVFCAGPVWAKPSQGSSPTPLSQRARFPAGSTRAEGLLGDQERPPDQRAVRTVRALPAGFERE
jgi:hypothetical protein